MSDTATRNKVSVQVVGDGGELEVRHTHPFPVEVSRIQILAGGTTWVAEGPVLVQPGYTETLVAKRGQRPWNAIARFDTNVGPDAVARVEQLYLKNAIRGAVAARDLLRYVEMEHEQAASLGDYHFAAFLKEHGWKERTKSLSESACVAVRTEITVGLLADQADVVRRRSVNGLLNFLDIADGDFSSCIDDETLVDAVRQALALGMLEEAYEVATHATDDSDPALERAKALRAERELRHWMDKGSDANSMAPLHALHASNRLFEYQRSAAAVEKREEIYRVGIAVTRDLASAFDFEQARVMATEMETHARTPEERRLAQQALAWLAYHEGTFLFRRRTSDADFEKASELFAEAALAQPIKARAYSAAVHFHQHRLAWFSVLLLFGVGVPLGARSKRVRRGLRAWRLRRAESAWLRGDTALAERRFSRVLDHLVGAEWSEEDSQVASIAAGRVLHASLQIGNLRNALDAADVLRLLAVGERPQGLQTPEGLGRKVARALAEGDSFLAQETSVVAERLFGPNWGTTVYHMMSATSASEVRRAQAWAEQRAHGEGVQLAAYLASLRLAQLGPQGEEPRAYWRAVLCNIGPRPTSVSSLQAWHRLRLWAASASGSTREFVKAVESDAHQDVPVFVGKLREDLLFQVASMASVPTGVGPEWQDEVYRAVSDLAEIQAMVHTAIPDAEGLDARLRLAALRRMCCTLLDPNAIPTTRPGILAEADLYLHRESTRTLAAAVDLFTPGDWGYDMWAQAEHANSGTLLLIEAVDHFTRGEFAEAAVLSAHVPTDAVSAARSAKVWCLRALVASKMGNASAAKSAYLRAVEADGLGVAVRRVGLVIAPLLQEAQLLSADIADPVARAAMETPSAAHELDLPHLAWFVSVGNSEIAEDFLGFACGRVGGVQGRAVLAEAYAHLVAHALRDFDYDKARRCAILQRGLEGESNQIPFEEEQAPADYIGWELTVDQVQKTLA